MKLTIRKTWPDHPMRDNDFVVLLDGKSLARIMLCVRADFREVWERRRVLCGCWKPTRR